MCDKPTMQLIILLSFLLISIVQSDKASYYEISGEGLVFANFQQFFGFYKKENYVHNSFPTYKKTDKKYVLYMHKNRHWTLNTANYEGQGHIRSIEKDLSKPQESYDWQFWNNTQWENDSFISVTPFKYPKSYELTYTGNDVRLMDIFERQNQSGIYERNNHQLTSIKSSIPSKFRCAKLI